MLQLAKEEVLVADIDVASFDVHDFSKDFLADFLQAHITQDVAAEAVSRSHRVTFGKL
jgi:hypothetical protein